jgi:hypothetical protein
MELVNGFFNAVFIWMMSGVFAIVLKRLSENIFKKVKSEKFSGSVFPKLITNIIIWIPILVAIIIEWSDQYALPAGFITFFGFIFGIFPYDFKYRAGVFIVLIFLGGVLFDVAELESTLGGKTEFIIIASAMSLGYAAGDITKKSRSIKGDK